MALSDYVSVDIETSALEPSNQGRITWLSALKISNGEIKDNFFRYLNTGIQLSPEVEELTKVRSGLLKQYAHPSIVYPEFISFTQQLPTVCHNADFVSKFLEYELGKYQLDGFSKYICTLEMSRKAFPGQRCQVLNVLQYLQINSDSVEESAPFDDTRGVFKIYEALK